MKVYFYEGNAFILNHFREVELGEHKVGINPDCSDQGFCAPEKITRCITNPEKQIIVHEGFNKRTGANDIALIRLNEPVPLFTEDPLHSSAEPVCLPWHQQEERGFDTQGRCARPACQGMGRSQCAREVPDSQGPRPVSLLCVLSTGGV